MQTPEPLHFQAAEAGASSSCVVAESSTRLELPSVDQVRLWLALKANPAVTTYCERPPLYLPMLSQAILISNTASAAAVKYFLGISIGPVRLGLDVGILEGMPESAG